MVIKNKYIIVWFLFGILSALGFLIHSDSVLIALFFILRLPGIIWLLCLAILFIFGAMVRYRTRWHFLASGDISNFSSFMKAWLLGQTAYFIGISVFCFTHWIFVKQGYGLAVAILITLIAFAMWWFASQLTYFMILNEKIKFKEAK